MSTIVIYKTKYGSTKTYADWIAEELVCESVDAKSVKIEDLEKYDTIVYGGGLYAEMEKLLVELCDVNGDFTDKAAIKELIEYVKH